jgi:hypothetical protein
MQPLDATYRYEQKTFHAEHHANAAQGIIRCEPPSRWWSDAQSELSCLPNLELPAVLSSLVLSRPFGAHITGLCPLLHAFYDFSDTTT